MLEALAVTVLFADRSLAIVLLRYVTLDFIDDEANWEGERPRRFKSPRSGMSGGPRRPDPVRASVRATGYKPSQVKHLYRRAGGT